MTDHRNPSKKRRNKGDRIKGQFFPMPHTVMNSAAYLGLTSGAKALLFELGLQVGPTNNGMLIATVAKLGPRGWSSSVIMRALRELEAAGLIYQTVKGHRPHWASWYGLGWLPLVDSDRYDVGTKAQFVLHAYLALAPKSPEGRSKNASLTPDSSVGRASIALDSSVEASAIALDSGAIEAISHASPTPESLVHLENAISPRSKAKQGKQAGTTATAPKPGNGTAWTARVIHPTPVDILAMRPPTAAGLRALFGNQPPAGALPGTSGSGPAAPAASGIVSRHWLQEAAA